MNKPPSAKPPSAKPDPIPAFISYRATTDIYLPGIGTIAANGVIEVDPNSATVAPFIAQGLLVK